MWKDQTVFQKDHAGVKVEETIWEAPPGPAQWSRLPLKQKGAEAGCTENAKEYKEQKVT